MTNAEIISKAMQLAGIEEPIHTFEAWKKLGFQVKKGEKTMIKIMIWKQGKQKEVEIMENGAKKKHMVEGNFFLKNSCFFGLHQVEPIK